MTKNVDLGDSPISNLLTEKYFFQGEDSIICEGLSFDICIYPVGLSGGIGFLGPLQKKVVLFGDFIKLAKIWVKCVNILYQFPFTYDSYVRFK